jgi:16S rRNA (guanine1207-N2)-methyltransferase
MNPRLTLAIEHGLIVLPETGPIGVFGADAEDDLSALPRDRVQVVQPLFPAAAALQAAGFATAPVAAGGYAAAVVFVPRAKDAARARIAEARRLTDGPMLIDGSKTDGIDSLLKELRGFGAAGEPLSKAHGKIFALTGALSGDWGPDSYRDIGDGFVTRPGVFSADSPDPASALLAGLLPSRLGPRVADLGAGWGYLSRAVLAGEGVERVDLVEADHVALDCAQRNLSDERAVFHWADALSFHPDAPFDAVVTNPPFHQGRAAEPALGRGFIAAAARLLAPRGALWLVANRHLPYEKDLAALFREVSEIGDHPSYKVFHATRPMKSR